MREIEKYIQFAIDNGYIEKTPRVEINQRVTEFRALGKPTGYEAINYIEIITSKPFIEAVARGIENILKEGEDLSIVINYKMYDYSSFSQYTYDKTDLLDDITYEQAVAIRDNKLPEFINNLLPKE